MEMSSDVAQCVVETRAERENKLSTFPAKIPVETWENRDHSVKSHQRADMCHPNKLRNVLTTSGREKGLTLPSGSTFKKAS